MIGYGGEHLNIIIRGVGSVVCGSWFTVGGEDT